jgi:hypothetical protein
MMKNFLFLLCVTTWSIFPRFQLDHVNDRCFDDHETRFKTSQTFMFPRPVYHNTAALMSLWNRQTATKEYPLQAAMQAIPIHQESIDSRETQWYFLLNCKSKLTVAGDTAEDRDVRAEWFDLPPDFRSTITLCPEERQSGVILQYHQHVNALIDAPLFESWWVFASAPIISTRHNLHFQEAAVENPGTKPTPQSMREALQQPFLTYAQMDNRDRTENGLSELRLGFGSTFINCDGFLLLYYTALGIPTHDRQKPFFIFAPFSGTNGHVDITTGVSFELPIIDTNNCDHLVLFFHGENHYLFNRTHQRTFDLKDKQWSRYLPVRRKNETHTVPASRVLTLPVETEPFSAVDISAGLALRGEHVSFEIGWNLWAHHDEHIDNICEPGCEKTDFAFTKFGIAGSDTRSASQSTITEQIDDPEDTFVTINTSDIDFSSGLSRGGHTQRLHAAMNYRNQGTCRTTFIGVGGYYEQPDKNFALENAGVWIKLGIEL